MRQCSGLHLLCLTVREGNVLKVTVVDQNILDFVSQSTQRCFPTADPAGKKVDGIHLLPRGTLINSLPHSHTHTHTHTHTLTHTHVSVYTDTCASLVASRNLTQYLETASI